MSITWEISTRSISNNQSKGLILNENGVDAALGVKICHCWEPSLSFFQLYLGFGCCHNFKVVDISSSIVMSLLE